MFSNISGTWLDGAFFNVLRYVDGMHLFFMTQVRVLAKICFALSFGISCVKLAMGAVEINKVLTQAFMSIMTYFIMIFMFPHIMINMQKIVSQLAHGAVFYQGFSVNRDGLIGREEEYFKYLNDIGTDSKGNTIWTVKGTKGDSRKALNLQITHKQTGIISLNKVFQMIIATFKAMWMSLNVKNVFDFFKHFPDFLMIIVIGLAYVWTLSVAIGQYTMVVIEYAFLYGIGVLFIPLMLWEGTKHAFEKLCGSIFNIGVKLLVVQITLYLAVMANIDILKNMFILSAGNIDFLQGLEFYLSVAFMIVFVKLFVDKAPAIAEFLCGGQPSLTFAGFARLAASGGVSGGVSGKASSPSGESTVRGAAAVGAVVTGAAGAAGVVARVAAGKAQLPGGISVTSKGMGQGIGQSAKQGGAKVMDKGISTAANAPKPAKDTGQLKAHGSNSGPAPAGKHEGKGGTDGTGGKSRLALAGGERVTESKNISEKVNDASEQHREKKTEGGASSGFDERLKALKSSIGEFYKADKKEVNNENTAKGNV
jgi:type IV secretory pathway TrbL component